MEALALQQFSKIFSEIPFNRILGLKLDAIALDHIILSFSRQDDLIGNFMHNILHGGVISSVLDMAGGTAAMVAAIQKRGAQDIAELATILSKASTISLHIDYIHPGKGERFIAKAYTLHSGSKITFTRMELCNQEGTLIANGSAAYRIG